MPALTLYTCLIEEQNSLSPFVQVYWAYATHIGEAIELMVQAARANGLSNPEPREIDPFALERLRAEVIPASSAQVFWAVNRHHFPPERVFQLPYGIIASCLEGEHDSSDITAGYSRGKNAEGMTTIEVNVERNDLLSLYERLLQVQDSYKVFWYLLHDHWEEQEDQFLVNEHLTSAATISAHLRRHSLDAVQNGYVTVTAYGTEGATNLNISDHKHVVVLTYADELAEAYCATLQAAGYPEVIELVSIDQGIHHWHYRHPDSRSRAALMAYLCTIGFMDWHPPQPS